MSGMFSAVLAATLVSLGTDNVVRVSDPEGRVSHAYVKFGLPVQADWRIVDGRGKVGAGRVKPWYVILSDGQKVYGFGVKVQPRAICSWSVKQGLIELDVDLRAGGQPLDLGDRTIEACEVVRMESVSGESAFAFGRRFCMALCPSPRLPKEPLYGFNDWYAAYGRNTATNFLADAAFVVSLAKGLKNRPYVVMDDGWQRYSPPEVQKLTGKFASGFGPWEESSPTFGMDMKAFCAKIAALGARPGLWYRPLCMKGTFCDPSDPATVARVQADIRRFRDWGFKLVKIDYLTYDFCGHFGTLAENASLLRKGLPWKEHRKTTAESIVELYRAIREAAGDDMVLLGCNAIGHLCAGIFEANRVGPDTSGRDWSVTRRNGVGAVAFKGVENGTFFAADPDCAGLATAGAIPWEKNRQWIDLLSRSGMPFFVSWHRNLADENVRAALCEGFHRAAKPQATAEALDWMDRAIPMKWNTASGVREYDWD